MKNRFLTTNEGLNNTKRDLVTQGYTKLPDCVADENNTADRLIIDTENKNYWMVDEPCFVQSEKQIKSQYDQSIVKVDATITLS
tara:strand:- start:25115 stop:25366 length:252 start_codon:yes stop_codon:yes gene_type:complete